MDSDRYSTGFQEAEPDDMLRDQDKSSMFGSLAVHFAVAVVCACWSAAVLCDSNNVNRELLRQEIRAELEIMLKEEGLLDRSVEKALQSLLDKETAPAIPNGQKSKVIPSQNIRPLSPDDHVYGNRDAPISLVEYSDFECLFCKRFHPRVKRFIDQGGGRVNWVYRHFPLAFHNPGAQVQAEASECAAAQGGDEAFWNFAALIFQRTASNGNGFPLKGLRPLAEEIGLDGESFQACLESGRMTGRVQSDYQNGMEAGIRGTPSSILLHHESHSTTALTGAATVTRLQSALSELERRQFIDQGEK